MSPVSVTDLTGLCPWQPGGSRMRFASAYITVLSRGDCIVPVAGAGECGFGSSLADQGIFIFLRVCAFSDRVA